MCFYPLSILTDFVEESLSLMATSLNLNCFCWRRLNSNRTDLVEELLKYPQSVIQWSCYSVLIFESLFLSLTVLFPTCLSLTRLCSLGENWSLWATSLHPKLILLWKPELQELLFLILTAFDKEVWTWIEVTLLRKYFKSLNQWSCNSVLIFESWFLTSIALVAKRW